MTTTDEQPTCGLSNGSIDVASVTGGVAPYTYSIDGVTYVSTTLFSDLAEGSYTIYVKDANGCEYDQSVTLQDIPGPTVSVDSVSPICEGFDVDLTASGALTYTWSDAATLSSASGSTVTASPTTTTTYTVVGTDANGCTDDAQVTVTVNPTPQTSPIFHN